MPMASAMGYKSILMWVCFIGITSASVELTGKWIDKFGWEFNCTWNMNANDTLQSVRLFRNDRQYLVHRPEIHNMQQDIDQRSLEFRLKVTCRLDESRGKTGHCITTVELFKPIISNTDLYRCDVSGERPTFMQESEEFEAFGNYHALLEALSSEQVGCHVDGVCVNNISYADDMVLLSASVCGIRKLLTICFRPSETKLKDVDSGKYLNCTAEGLPPPRLVWTTDQGQKVPEIFQSASWNYYKKLWLSWSTVEVQGSSLQCTAQLPLRNGTLVVANSATPLWHSSGRYFAIFGLTHLVFASLFSSFFLR